jgi:hypothetical protein
MANRRGRIPENPEVRFLRKVIKTDNCWLWVGAKHSHKGYGSFSNGKKIVKTHRFAYEHFIGPIPENMCVLHKCDTPSCVRPEHLFLGSNQDNVDDKLSKNRHPKGQICVNSKLSDEQVVEIKKAQLSYYWGQNSDLANVYNVSNRTISDIKIGKRWTHISIP